MNKNNNFVWYLSNGECLEGKDATNYINNLLKKYRKLFDEEIKPAVISLNECCDEQLPLISDETIKNAYDELLDISERVSLIELIMEDILKQIERITNDRRI